MAHRPEMFAPTRGFSWMADSMETCTVLWGRSLLLWQRNLGKFELFFENIAHESSCMPDRPDKFGPTSGDEQWGRSVLPKQRHLRQARSLIAYRLVTIIVDITLQYNIYKELHLALECTTKPPPTKTPSARIHFGRH